MTFPYAITPRSISGREQCFDAFLLLTAVRNGRSGALAVAGNYLELANNQRVDGVFDLLLQSGVGGGGHARVAVSLGRLSILGLVAFLTDTSGALQRAGCSS